MARVLQIRCISVSDWVTVCQVYKKLSEKNINICCRNSPNIPYTSPLCRCLNYKRNYNNKHKDKINDEQMIKYKEDAEYKNRFMERKRQWANKRVTCICDVCNCSISQQRASLHRLTNKHKHNLENH